MENTCCPVCGYDLGYSAWLENSPSDEICPSCGTHFGYDDIVRNLGDSSKTFARYGELRNGWISSGMKWWSRNPQNPQPAFWDPKEQLKNVCIEEN